MTIPDRICCNEMGRQLKRACGVHPDRWDCPDCVITYSQSRGTFGLMIHDGGTSSYHISFCPWCGMRLPESVDSRPA